MGVSLGATIMPVVIAGATAFGVVGHRLPRRAVFIGGFISIALFFWLLALLLPLPVAILVATGVSIAVAPLHPLIDTIKQEQVPASSARSPRSPGWRSRWGCCSAATCWSGSACALC